jgi:hypothetical protein
VQAKAMLLKAVAAVNGINVAISNPNAKQLLGTDERALKDPTRKAFGMELHAAGQKSA